MNCYIIDLDGTIYRGDTALSDASEFVQYLNEKGSKYLFFTNCPEKSPQMTENRLRAMSIPVPEGSVLNSGILSVDYISNKADKTSPVKVNILGSGYMKDYARSLGMVVTRQKPDYVLVAFSCDITVDDLHKACSQIKRGAKFIATNPDDAIPTEEGLQFHTGAIIDIIKKTVGKEPVIVGKPSDHMKDYFLSRFKCVADDICVVGDRLDTDMKFARNSGFKALLMLTGMTCEEYAGKHKEDFDAAFHSLSELRRYQEEQEKEKQ